MDSKTLAVRETIPESGRLFAEKPFAINQLPTGGQVSLSPIGLDGSSVCSQLSEHLGTQTASGQSPTRQQLEKICAPQHLRSLLGYKIDTDQHGAMQACLWCDWQEYQRLVTHYFGLRVLISDRAEWSTAEIIEAYRGQAKAEAAFREMKDPYMLSIRPQFHWTDQKLHFHAFICATAYLLLTLLHCRATSKTAYQGSSRRLLAELATIRYCRLIESTGRRGRPRVRMQIEEMDSTLTKLAETLNAIPSSA
jgi:hypothetical protein